MKFAKPLTLTGFLLVLLMVMALIAISGCGDKKEVEKKAEPAKAEETVKVDKNAEAEKIVAKNWTWKDDLPRPEWFKWGKDYWPTEPVSGGYYRVANSQYIGLLNPNHWPVNDWIAMAQLYEMVIYNDGEFRASFPWLLKSFEFTSPTTLVAKLRQGIQFHDGTDFNAESFKYQLEWIMDKNNGAWTRNLLKPIESIELIDEFTINFTFNIPWAAFPGIMANIPGKAISMKALKGDVALLALKKTTSKITKFEKKLKKAKAKNKAKKIEKFTAELAKFNALHAKLTIEAKDAVPLDKWAVGTGVNMMEDASPGNYLRLKRNPNWWFGKSIGRPEMPYFDGWLITVIPDPSVRLANFKAAKLDSMGISPAQWTVLKDDPKYTIVANEHNGLYSMYFNTQAGPAKDIRVRKAISHAIDRKAIVHGVEQGLGVVASAMYNSSHWTHNPNLKPVTHDPELSRKLLAEAGYKDGLVVKGAYLNVPEAVTRAEAMKSMLMEVGIDWQVDFLTSAALNDRLRNAEYDFTGGGWSWIWDPDLMPSGLYMPEGGFNFGRSDNKAVQELILKGRTEVDVAKRQKIYWEIERLVYESYEDVFLFWPVSASAYNKNVQGWNNDFYIKGRNGTWFSHPMWFATGKESGAK